MAYSLSLVPEITHENMMLWVGRTQNYVLLSILIMISARHFQLGIQVILEDYISTIKFRDFYIKLVNIIYYFLMFLGLIAIAKIYFGAQL
jgi:succinate dehydrogenase hydrophobic anchor subunit